MAYLSPVAAGGATHFTNAGVSIDPQPGSLLVWNNAREDGVPNEDAMHAGTPVLDGLGPIGGLDHGPDEYIEADSIVPRTALLTGVILGLCQHR